VLSYQPVSEAEHQSNDCQTQHHLRAGLIQIQDDELTGQDKQRNEQHNLDLNNTLLPRRDEMKGVIKL
jgi:hypothetical protein